MLCGGVSGAATWDEEGGSRGWAVSSLVLVTITLVASGNSSEGSESEDHH